MRMQHIGSIGTNGHMKPERERDNFRFLQIIVSGYHNSMTSSAEK